MVKDYYDSNLKKYFEKYVTEMEVNNEFKPLLVDILLRRAYEFDLTPLEIQQDMTALLNSLRKIKIGKIDKENPNTCGIYIPKEKKIVINEDIVRKSFKRGPYALDDLYVTLTHEVYHALAIDEDGNDRLTSINNFTGKKNNTLLEAIIETAADRTVFSRTEKDRYFFRKETNGYPEMTFVVPALAATYGITEREFLKHALLGRNNLINFLSNKEKEPYNFTSAILDGVELNLAKMHKALYSKNSEEISPQKRRELISESIFAISYICNSKLEDRYAKEVIPSAYRAKEFVENAKYNHIRLHRIINIEMDNLNQTYGINVVPRITEMREETEYDEKRILMDMDRVVSKRYMFPTEKEFLTLFDYAKKGSLNKVNKAYLRERGIEEIDRDLYFPSIDIRVVRRFEDEDFPTDLYWNNRPIRNYISKYIPKLVPRRNIAKYISDKYEEISYKGKRLQGRKKQESKARKPINIDASDYFRLPDDELKVFNRKTQEILQSPKPNSPKNLEEKDKGE